MGKKYAISIRCLCSEERVVPAVYRAYPCPNCGDLQAIRLISLPDDPRETRSWEEVKMEYTKLRDSFRMRTEKVQARRPLQEEDERGRPLGVWPQDPDSSLWCAPCLYALWERAKARKLTKIKEA